MVEAVLQLFMSEEKAQSILATPLIEAIFIVLFVTFVSAVLVHFFLYIKLRKIRHFLTVTDSLEIEPLSSFKEEFVRKQSQESLRVETFVQQKFSGWRVLHVPVVSLIKILQMTVSVFILLGVLGTFIGLSMSLGSVDTSGEQLVENVANVLAGLDTAFYTSIAGMGLSLMMTVLLRIANTEYMLTDIMLKVESYLEENEADAMTRLIDVSKTIHGSIVELRETNQQSLQSIEQSFHGFREYTTGLQQSAKDLAKFNEGLAENLKDFTELFASIKEVTDGLSGAVTKLNTNFGQLFSTLTKMDKRNERLITAFQDTYRKIEELSVSQTETLRQFEASMEDWKEYLSAMAASQEGIHASFEKIHAQSDMLVKTMKENNRQFQGIFGENVSSKLAGISTYLRELKGDFDKLGNAVVRLPEALDTINTAQMEYKHLLSDRFDELKQFNKDFQQHLQAHSSESATFEKHLQEASITYEQLGSKNNQLLNEINRTIAQMTASFQQREDQIEASVGILKDSLSTYVSKLEGTMGDKLDKITRSIGGYVTEMNEALKKEWKQIGDITEDSQQRTARHTQQVLADLSEEIQHLNRRLFSLAQESDKYNQRVRVGSND
ncbi:MotA/TolQ/ExbB proton channel family protein [Evansella caseinilytica]|uniref:MotA/TolQ/ExbB proton channel family protein n=1 Tax=Evansella caseinilytica TaxID=1503961 RepID=A0A1H3GMF8_9BACI|nr:MotA/TolQ/ExbB proton channel family protein [Evansella caseinilytica]SDY03694.1 MotA/TolQ/ExbB proton channel family protein [Evansella caseinilytica]